MLACVLDLEKCGRWILEACRDIDSGSSSSKFPMIAASAQAMTEEGTAASSELPPSFVGLEAIAVV